MKRAYSVVLVLLLLAPAAGAGPEPSPELKSLLQALEPVTAGLKPEAVIKVSSEGQVLTVTHLPQTFKIHNVSKDGRVSETSYDEVGPSYRGLLLKVQVRPKGEVYQAVTPQTLRRPYWAEDLNVTPVAGSEKQFFWTLAYGSRTERKLLEEIRQKVRALAAP